MRRPSEPLLLAAAIRSLISCVGTSVELDNGHSATILPKMSNKQKKLGKQQCMKCTLPMYNIHLE